MKKLLALIGMAAVTATAQTNSPYFWTNGATIWTNIQMGALSFPMTSNGYNACLWAANQWNTQYGLTGTNRFTVKDAFACAAWMVAEQQWYAQWTTYLQQQADAKATILKIKARLNSGECSDAQLAAALTALGL